MELELSYDTQEAIPAGYEALYKERGGKWVLSGIKGIKTQTDVDNVQNALNKERAARKEIETKLKKFEKLPADLDVDDLLEAQERVTELTTQLEEAKKGKGSDEEAIQRRIDAAVNREKKVLQKKIDELNGLAETERKRADQLDGTMKLSTIETALQRAALESKMRGEAISDVLLYANNFEVIVDEVTKKSRVVTRDNIGIPPGETPENWLVGQKEKKPHWWPESNGGGARGSAAQGVTGNPFAKGSLNMTEASKLKTKDSAKADAYAKAAGYESADHAFATAPWGS